MSKASETLLALGIVLLISGIIFALQGYGLVGGSFMSGNPFWMYAGTGIALFGLAIAILGYIMGMNLPVREKRQ